MEKIRIELIIPLFLIASSCAAQMNFNTIISNGYKIVMSEIILSSDSLQCLNVDKEVFPFHYTSGNQRMDSIIFANELNIFELLDDNSFTSTNIPLIKLTKQECANELRIKFSQIKESFFCAIIYESPIERSFDRLYGSFTYVQFHVKENNNTVDIHYLTKIHIEP